MRIELRRQAEDEIDDAAAWYERNQPGLGSAFTQAVISALSAIAQQPSAYPPVGRGARRFIIRRFPYVIVYRVQDDVIVVYACIHTHRDP